MKKTILISLSTLLFVSIAVLAYQHLCVQAVAAKNLKACEVSVPIVETIYAGKECICFSPVFEIYNPNAKSVYLSKFSYELDVKVFYFAGQQIPINLYIPAKKKVRFSGAVPAPWVAMSMWLVQTKGISMGEGMKEVIPFWKGWGGKLFNAKLKDAWEKAKPENPEFVFTGEFEISSDGVESRQPYKATWKID